MKTITKEMRENTIGHQYCDICKREYGRRLDTNIDCMVSYDQWEGEHAYCHFDICPGCFVTKVTKLLMETYNIPLYPYETGESDPRYSYKSWEEVENGWGYQRGISVKDF